MRMRRLKQPCCTESMTAIAITPINFGLVARKALEAKYEVSFKLDGWCEFKAKNNSITTFVGNTFILKDGVVSSVGAQEFNEWVKKNEWKKADNMPEWKKNIEKYEEMIVLLWNGNNEQKIIDLCLENGFEITFYEDKSLSFKNNDIVKIVDLYDYICIDDNKKINVYHNFNEISRDNWKEI